MRNTEWIKVNIEKNTELRDPDYYYFKGLSFYYGWGEVRDIEISKKNYDEGVKLGSAKCKYAKALSLSGVEQKKMFTDAFFKLNTEANNGDSESQRMISCYYLTNERGVEQNIDVALNWLKSSASLDNPISLFNLGCCYLKGEYVEKNKVKAIEYFSKSAELGYAKAKIMIDDIGE